MKIEVVNKYKHKFGEFKGVDIYIGRGTCLGNPYTHLKGKTKAEFVVNTRDESIEKYRDWLSSKLKSKDQDVRTFLRSIYGVAKEQPVNLVCYCSPQSCHGDVIKEVLLKKWRKENETT